MNFNALVAAIRTLVPKTISSALPREIAVVAVSAKKSRALNRTYRRKDRATNILSFRYDEKYGEIILCLPVIKDQAKLQKNSEALQVTRMIVHGMLHLGGMHHEDSLEIERKALQLEKRILSKLF